MLLLIFFFVLGKVSNSEVFGDVLVPKMGQVVNPRNIFG